MANNSNKEKHISVRVTNGTHSELTIYAKAHNCTLSKAIEDLVEAGLKAEHVRVATKEDIELLMSDNKRRDLELEKALKLLQEEVKNQPITVQQSLLEPSEHTNKKKSLFKKLFS